MNGGNPWVYKVHIRPKTEFKIFFFACISNNIFYKFFPWCFDFFLFPANIYFFKVDNKNTTKRCEVCSKLTIKTPEKHHWHCSGIFIGNFELILHHFLVFLLLFWTSKCWLGSKFDVIFDWHCEINLVLKSLKSAYKGINFTCAVELQLKNFVGIF